MRSGSVGDLPNGRSPVQCDCQTTSQRCGARVFIYSRELPRLFFLSWNEYLPLWLPWVVLKRFWHNSNWNWKVDRSCLAFSLEINVYGEIWHKGSSGFHLLMPSPSAYHAKLLPLHLPHYHKLSDAVLILLSDIATASLWSLVGLWWLWESAGAGCTQSLEQWASIKTCSVKWM